MDNFRDVAGVDADSTYRTAGGALLRRGVFYRSSALLATPGQPNALEGLDIHTVYDLRTPAEIARQPDALPPGAQYVRINVLVEDTVTFGSLSSAADTIDAMESLQRELVTNPAVRERLAALFTALADGQPAQLYHCTGGKDRTGWVSALLQLHAGVTLDDVMHDYLLTNQLMTAFIDQHYAAVAQSHGQAAAQAILPALSVRDSFLLAGLDQLRQDYTDVDGYLARGLGLDHKTRDRLRDKLLA